MNKEEIREYISCPQFGDNYYGKWGALSLEQRIAYKNLIFECEDKDKIIKELLQRINKAIDYIDTLTLQKGVYDTLKEILKGEENENK